MRKVSIFNWKNRLLLWLLVCGMLSNEALEVNWCRLRSEKTEMRAKYSERGAEDEVKTVKETATDKFSNSEQIPFIRVLLMTTDYESYEHEAVSGICKGEAFTYTPDSPELNTETETVRIYDESGGITLTSIERQCGHPVYSGTLEIARHGDRLTVINEVPLETYLESVVPSEMPASYEKEALMAQAVCARTYAFKHMLSEEIKGYPADVDDSVNNQVYGNILPQESTTEAVKATEGEILRQNGEPIETYYFSTSAGFTSTDEIWGAREAASYLKSVECNFDKDMPWSRWEVEIPWENFKSRQPQKGGELVSIEIRKKSMSGAVTELLVNREESSFSVQGEYEIRKFLSPIGCELRTKDGGQVKGGTLLPSAYFEMEIFPKEKLRLTGRGYGHGVGMSQNGANEMAMEGWNYREILTYFFKDVEITALD